jgi:RecG-like helicase
MQLTELFGDKVSKLLIQNNINTVYDFINILPYKWTGLRKLGLNELIESGYLYKSSSTLVKSQCIFSKNTRWILDFELENGSIIRLSYFNSSRYLHKSFVEGEIYHIIFHMSDNGFLLLNKFGKTPIDYSFILSYPKNGLITSTVFNKLHSKVPKALYKLNIEGLCTVYDIFGENIDLYSIHHPTSEKEWLNTMQQYQIFKAYLELSVLKAYKNIAKIQQVQASNIEVSLLNTILPKLKFELTTSQLESIQSITKSFTFDKN